MNKREIKRQLKRIKNDPKNWELIDDGYCSTDQPYYVNFLGTFMYLDPCGRYHHFLSPNGITKRCERFWHNLNSIANSLNMWIEEGEGDPCDIFICKY